MPIETKNGKGILLPRRINSLETARHAHDSDERLASVERSVASRLGAERTSGRTRIQRVTPIEKKRSEQLSDDGHPDAKSRPDFEWLFHTVGHTEFEPLDNFAQHGWQTFQDSVGSGAPDASGLMWALHAVGDAVVPMHAMSTTSWGHRPFEDWTNDHWDLLTFNVDSAVDPSDSTKRVVSSRCAVSNFAGNASGLANGCKQSPTAKSDQFLQAHRVLEYGYYWHTYLKTHGIRDFITALARETATLATTGGAGYLLCDECSYDYALTHQTGVEKDGIEWSHLWTQCSAVGPYNGTITNWTSYYDTREDNARLMVERGMGAAVALLMQAGSQVGCQTIGNTCGGSSTCCGGTCQGSKCCFADQEACESDADCCSGTCNANNQCGALCLMKGASCTVGGTSCCSPNQCLAGICDVQVR
jgi:hypothetical protein